MAAVLPVSWEVCLQSKEFAVCKLLPYYSTTNGVAPSAATVASAKTAVSAVVFVSGVPSCTIFRRKMLEWYFK